VPDQQKNAGNEGDVMKHAPLRKVLGKLSEGKGEFWYVETHAGYPCYFLPPRGSKHLDKGVNDPLSPQLLKHYLKLAYYKQKTHDGFPAKRTYLGSAAQVFHLLRAKEKRIWMTLFEMNDEAAGQLFQYFRGQERTCAVLIGMSDDASWFKDRLPQWWDEAADRAKDDLVMIVQGDSYAIARSLWENRNEKSKPDLVFVDPFKLEDSNGQPEGILNSLHNSKVPSVCWTPLNGKTTKWNRLADWTFQDGVQNASDFVRSCQQNITPATN
jgi:hypothetical protein